MVYYMTYYNEKPKKKNKKGKLLIKRTKNKQFFLYCMAKNKNKPYSNLLDLNKARFNYWLLEKPKKEHTTKNFIKDTIITVAIIALIMFIVLSFSLGTVNPIKWIDLIF